VATAIVWENAYRIIDGKVEGKRYDTAYLGVNKRLLLKGAANK
jgi:hypothetical protein